MSAERLAVQCCNARLCGPPERDIEDSLPGVQDRRLKGVRALARKKSEVPAGQFVEHVDRIVYRGESDFAVKALGIQVRENLVDEAFGRVSGRLQSLELGGLSPISHSLLLSEVLFEHIVRFLLGDR